MVLDTFMEGFLFDLFMQKWKKFARNTLVFLMTIDVGTFAMLVAVGMDVRSPPDEHNHALIYGTMTGTSVQVIFNLVAMQMWLTEMDGSFVRLFWNRALRHEWWVWFRRNGLPRKFLTFAFAMAGCSCAIANHDGGLNDITRSMISLAAYFDATGLLSSLFLPFQRLGVFALVVDKLLTWAARPSNHAAALVFRSAAAARQCVTFDRSAPPSRAPPAEPECQPRRDSFPILLAIRRWWGRTADKVCIPTRRGRRTDLPVFMFFLFGYTITFYFTLYIAYPVHNDDETLLAVSPAFNDPFTAAKAMIDLSINGAKFPLNVDDPWVTSATWPSLIVFTGFYYMCMIMIVTPTPSDFSPSLSDVTFDVPVDVPVDVTVHVTFDVTVHVTVHATLRRILTFSLPKATPRALRSASFPGRVAA